MPDLALTGWGRTTPTVARVTDAADRAQVIAAIRGAGPRGVVARGLGRSYGDAAQNAGGTVLTTTLDRILDINLELGTVTCEAGVSLDHLMRVLLPLGWFVPVTPGTRFVSVGGAIAADIHGKNHHVAGSFAQHVSSLELVLADGSLRRLGPETELFWATAGGMGLTGVIVAATIALHPVETSWMRVDTERSPDLDDLLDRLTATDHRYRYSVAWIDCLARGAKLGRAVITRGDHAPLAALPAKARPTACEFAPRTRLGVPGLMPNGLLRPLTVAAFNEFWYRKAPLARHGELQRLATFFHPLDGLRDWNRIYGSQGFLQYQFVVPIGAEEVLRAILERISALGCPSFLAVLKRFGPGNPGLLSFPAQGWTLALDIPAAVAGLAGLLDELDEAVVAVAGRVYLAKDSRLRPDLLGAMYPRLDEFRAIRAEVDPQGVFRSDLARRLGL